MNIQSPFLKSIEQIESALCFIYRGEDLLLLKHTTLPPILQCSEFSQFMPIRQFYIGTQLQNHCFALEVDEHFNPPETMFFQPLKQSFNGFADEHLSFIASKAKQFLTWDKSNQYCGHCGSKTDFHSVERARVCMQCDFLFFPQISPVVMVCITKGNQVLLARSPHFPPGIYSVLAGFVEPGETIEQTAHREVAEEVSIKIKNLKYFGSQPWPFPSNLMIGFTAEYDSGEIVIDENEIEDAQWFDINKLPELSKRFSLSRQMIEDAIANMVS